MTRLAASGCPLGPVCIVPVLALRLRAWTVNLLHLLAPMSWVPQWRDCATVIQHPLVPSWGPGIWSPAQNCYKCVWTWTRLGALRIGVWDKSAVSTLDKETRKVTLPVANQVGFLHALTWEDALKNSLQWKMVGILRTFSCPELWLLISQYLFHTSSPNVSNCKVLASRSRVTEFSFNECIHNNNNNSDH
jgi:hypothetical protein